MWPQLKMTRPRPARSSKKRNRLFCLSLEEVESRYLLSGYTFTKIADTTGFLADFYGRTPSINASGAVAFVAGLDDGGRGVYTGSGGPLTTIVERHDGFQTSFGVPSINSDGTVAVTASGLLSGVMRGNGGPLTTIATVGGKYTAFGGGPGINDNGVVAFRGAGTGYDSVAVGSGGAITTIADSNGPFGYGNPNFFGNMPSINNSGLVAFYAPLDDGSTGIFSGNGGGTKIVASKDGTFKDFGPSPSINDSGTVAFLAYTQSANTGFRGIYTETSGGTPTKFVDASGPYAAFGDPSINGTGTVAFLAFLDNQAVGIYTGPNPTANKVIQTGDALDGSTVTGLLGGFDHRGLNDAGQVAFLATLADGRTVVYRASPTDSDGDGLPDDWELHGYQVTVNGKTIFVDLHEMGANPYHKDIFIESDYMIDPSTFLHVGHSHQLKQAAIDIVVSAFANAPVGNPDGSTGIALHVDNGPASVMNPVTGERWGQRSQSNSLTESEFVESNGSFDWTAFDTYKNGARGSENDDGTATNLSAARARAFHYVISAHDIKIPGRFTRSGQDEFTSGISRGLGASDFIVALAEWNNGGTVEQQAGTFMHELGHNLGLSHGGGADLATNNKPNYLSVMNYLFQMRGLRINGKDSHFDYSRFELPSLDENSLSEPSGLGNTTPAGYGTRYYVGDNVRIVDYANDSIDWNGDSLIDYQHTEVANINNDRSQNDSPVLGVLTGHNDWPGLVYGGGSIGDAGLSYSPPMVTNASDELTQSQDQAMPTSLSVSVASSGDVTLAPGTGESITFTFRNLGSDTDTYLITSRSALGWADFSRLPASISLAGGESRSFAVPVSVPITASDQNQDILSVEAASTTNPLARDSSTTIVSVAVPSPPSVVGFLINDGSAQRSMVNGVTYTFSTVVSLDPGAFELTRQGGGSFSLIVSPSAAGALTKVTLSFVGGTIVGGSLPDGKYTLTVHREKIHEPSLLRLSLDADRVDQFFRFFGDTNGDGAVDTTDYFVFRGAYGKTQGQGGYLWFLDFNADAIIGQTDNTEFAQRRGKRLNS